MQTTTTDLPTELRTALTTAGLTPRGVTIVVRLLRPAGQNAMVQWLGSPDAVREITATYLGEVADRLRVTWADAAIVRCELRAATR